MIQEKLNRWADDLSLLEGTERLTYLVELAKQSTTLPEELRTDDRLVPGCISKIWVEVGLVENKVKVYYDSDAMIPKGIATIVCDIFTNCTKQEARDFDWETGLQKLGFVQLVTPQRRNGLYNLIGVLQNKIAMI
jgi:cysteine desulfuration protein SufE